MTRPCTGCSLWHCDGQCFDESPADYPDAVEEASVPRAPYVPSPEYLAWCEEADAKRAAKREARAA